MKLLEISLLVSRWGKQHAIAARYLIVASHLLLTILAGWWGIFLFQQAIEIPSSVFVLAMIVFMLAVLVYPTKHKVSFLNHYIRQKSCDFILVASTFFMMLQATNHFCYSSEIGFSLPLQNAAHASMLSKPSKETVAPTLSTPPKKLSWKEKIQLKKDLIKKYFEIDKEYTDAEKVGYAILGILGATILLFLVMMLACNLSCSGAEGLAAMVGIVGTGGIIFLLVLLFKHLRGKKKPIQVSA